MGSCQVKEKKSSSKASDRAVQELKNKVSVLQAQVEEMARIRQAERHAYELDLMAFALNKSDWNREKQTLKDEVNRQQSLLRSNINSAIGRDETLENKWKHLYFSIKDELDHLIHRTHQEERVWSETEKEEVLLELKNEVKARGQTIEALQAKVAKMKQKESKREKEMDILRQSLRIMSHSSKPSLDNS